MLKKHALNFASAKSPHKIYDAECDWAVCTYLSMLLGIRLLNKHQYTSKVLIVSYIYLLSNGKGGGVMSGINR